MIESHLDRVRFGIAGAVSFALLTVHRLAEDPILRETAWLAVVVGAVVAILAGMRWHRPLAPAPWWALGVSMALLAFGNVLNHPAWDAPAGALLLAQVTELIAFPLLGLAALGMVRRQKPQGDREGALDGAIVMVALATVLSGVVFTAEVVQATTMIGYVLMVVAPLLLAGVAASAARLLFVGTRATSLTLLAGATGLALFGHVLRTFTQAAGTYERGTWEDVFIGLAYAAVGLAAVHPSMVRLTTPSSAPEGRLTNARLVTLGAALVTPPVTLVFQDRPTVIPLLASALVSVLVLWRLWDLVLQRERVRDEMARQASHDGLTGLPNRTQLLARLDAALQRRRDADDATAVLFIDLDGFKRVNDDHGHRAGDETLLLVAQRLREILRDGDLLGRLSGDEFVILCDSIAESSLLGVAERALEVFRRPFALSAVEVALGASIGISVRTTSGEVPEQMLHEADAAMYVAKQRGDGSIEVYGDALGDRLRRRRQLEIDLPGAVRAGALTLVYQPIHELEGLGGATAWQAAVGVEALVRWEHPELGAIAPSELIPIADATGAIDELGRWVLREACEQLTRWRAAAAVTPGFRLFVNLSPRQLLSAALPAQVLDTLQTTGVGVADVVLEVTETAVLDTEVAVETVLALRSHGIAIALDDFGTGYSSLTHLKHLPLDLIKIDATFVRDLGTSADDRAIVSAVISIARQRGATVIGEGVEDAAQQEVLRLLGCDLAQGYHLGIPLQADDLVVAPLAARPSPAR